MALTNFVIRTNSSGHFKVLGPVRDYPRGPIFRPLRLRFPPPMQFHFYLCVLHTFVIYALRHASAAPPPSRLHAPFDVSPGRGSTPRSAS
ncbi:integral membrane protein, GNS1/SUR4 family, putative [Plasmodium ovale wallikeri]|uniref:Integral membrane protein, GNS1/SUR4 family, putative n=1 Tax=Plasmodium ovale wallikeri TaxID=864142 RepID=A0A1A8YH96_PLAOA|nr:integral membrane protein, GNS1/SUR4 family, putative [Plasmodium ovale wallikeri]